jgi:hypothetical protein
MKNRYIALSAAIASALCSFPSMSSAAMAGSSIANADVGEAPRITQTINNHQLFTIPKTHLAFLASNPVSCVLLRWTH